MLIEKLIEMLRPDTDQIYTAGYFDSPHIPIYDNGIMSDNYS